MAREISRTTQQHQTHQSKESEMQVTPKGVYGVREARPAEAQVYHDKSAINFEAQSLTCRKVSPQNLILILHLAERDEWSGFSSAVQKHCSNLEQLDNIISLLRHQRIDLPEDIQNFIGNHFKKLYVQETLPKLIEDLHQ